MSPFPIPKIQHHLGYVPTNKGNGDPNDSDFKFIGVGLGIIRIIDDEMRLNEDCGEYFSPIGGNMRVMGQW